MGSVYKVELSVILVDTTLVIILIMPELFIQLKAAESRLLFFILWDLSTGFG